MGTRSTISIMDGDTELLRIYRQYDGYLEGMGVDLATLLENVTITNGIAYEPENDASYVSRRANGMGELAAHVLMLLKQQSPKGNVYVIAPNGPRNSGEEYAYIVSQDTKTRRPIIAAYAVDWNDGSLGKRALFKGAPSKLLAKYRPVAA